MANIKTIKLIDKYCGSFLCAVLGLLQFFMPKRITKQKKILLIQLWGLGETVLALPAIKALKEYNKKNSIAVLTTDRVKDIFFDNVYIDSVLVVELNPFSIVAFMIRHFQEYDLVIDMEEYLNVSAIMAFFLGMRRIGYDHGFRSWLYSQKVPYNDQQHVTQTFMDLLVPLRLEKKINELEKLHYSKKDNASVSILIKKNKIKKPMLLLSPGAAESSKIRMWPNEKWAELIEKLQQEWNGSIILLGGIDIKPVNQTIISLLANAKGVYDVSGQTNVPELIALIDLSQGMISIDSGPMHLAAAQGIKTIGLFGPNTPVRFGPLGRYCTSIYKPLTQPVINVHLGQVPDTAKFDNMSTIGVEDVMKAVEKTKMLH